MPKGLTTLSFHGGPNDGEVIADVPAIRVFPKLSLPTGSGFTEEPDGRVGVFVKAMVLPANWSKFRTARYVKREAVPNSTGVHYDFVETATVSRCRALTMKNEWCKNEAIADQKVCTTHARSKSLALKPDF